MFSRKGVVVIGRGAGIRKISVVYPLQTIDFLKTLKNYFLYQPAFQHGPGTGSHLVPFLFFFPLCCQQAYCLRRAECSTAF
jgi:hypothetical protein